MIKATIPAILVAALIGTPAGAAPIAPLSGVTHSPVEQVQFRFGWHYHPLVHEPGAWAYHQYQWDRFEGRRGAYNARASVARAYRGRHGRRVVCR